MEVKGFTDKGFLKLSEVKHHAVLDPKPTSTNTLENRSLGGPILEGIEEDTRTELKTSIVYPAGKVGEPDIDAQLYIILKGLTAFMNTEGGTLYIGVHDKTKRIVGIKNDYEHLNDGDDDEYNGTYATNNDGYQLKIRNRIDKLCPSVANDLINITFIKVDDIDYCKIEVRKAKRPIWLDGNKLYVRQGNRLKKLEGDAITFFITERMSLSIHDIIDVDGLTMPSTTMNEEQLRDILHKIINERRVSVIAPPPPSLLEIDYWLVWNDDCTWMRKRDKADANKLQVPVYKNMSNPLVVFCYENNRINVVKLSVFRNKVNLNIIQKKAWCEENSKPKNIFVAEPSSLLVLHSIDYNNIEYVKLHALTDFSPTAAAKNSGAPILPDGGKVLSYSVIGAEHRGQLAHLICTKAKRSTDMGTPISSPALSNEIDYLKKIGKQ